MRIVFMGTPDFAVPSLQKLLDAGYDVVSVLTQPDRPSGRGNKLAESPVKVLALQRGVPVLQPERVRRQEGLDALRALAPDLFVTAAFGQILSQKVLDIPSLGTVNVHASLLPAYRGPAPVHWSIIEGETVTGVTTMLTDIGIDTGDILLRREVAIKPHETADGLTERLALAGAELLLETLQRIEAGDCPRTPQDHSIATRYPMLEKEHGRIDWAQSAARVASLVRGVNPWPGAWTTLPGGEVLKIWEARTVGAYGKPGEILCADSKDGLTVACGEGALEVLRLQAPGAKQMPSRDYLRGHSMERVVTLGKEDT